MSFSFLEQMFRQLTDPSTNTLKVTVMSNDNVQSLSDVVVDGEIPVFDGTTGKIIRTSSVLLSTLQGKVTRAGEEGGQVQYGGTAAGDAWEAYSTSNVTKGAVILGQSYKEFANGKIGIFNGTKDAISGALHVKSIGNSYADAIVLETTGGDLNSNNKYIVYPDGSELAIGLQSGPVQFMNTQGRYRLGVGQYNFFNNYGNSSSNTDPTNPSAGSDPVFAIQNASATNDNFGAVAFVNSGAVPTSMMVGVHEGHVSGSSGHLRAYVRDAGTLKEMLRIAPSCAFRNMQSANETAAIAGTLATVTEYLKVLKSDGSVRYIPLVTTPN